MMRPLWTHVNAWLSWFHRWAGVVLALLFAAWFVSGAVLHFVAFPSLPLVERVAGSEPVDLTRLEVAPREVLAQAPEADGLKLVSRLGRPVYLASSAGSYTAVAGDTGDVLRPISAAEAAAIAMHFAHAPVSGTYGPLEYDQWVVHQQFDPYRPFFRVRLNDPQQTELYVSARTAAVVQRTRGSERLWNWCGAVLHWIYFTPVRKDWSVWNQLVWWVSLIALLTSIAGTWLGIHRYLRVRRVGAPGLSPYRGWLRWHHIIGLFASVVVLFWIFSGWLSMDHGRLFPRGGVTADEAERVRGVSLVSLANASSLQVLRSAGPALIIELNAVAGRPFLSLRGGGGSPAVRLIWLPSGERSLAPIPTNLLVDGVSAVWPGSSPDPQASNTDELYRLAESVPAEALAIRAGGDGETRVYVDRSSARLLAVMGPGRRAYAWVYYGLHTLSFPGLISHPLARTVLVELLLLGGLGFCVTGVVLAVRRLKIQFS